MDLSIRKGFNMRSKLRCKSISQLCVGIFMGNVYTTLHPNNGDGVKSSHTDKL